MKKKLLSTLCGWVLVCAMNSMAADQVMEMKVSTSRGTGDDAIIVIWAENDTGDFVKTIQMFSKNKEYYKDMLAWRFKSRNKDEKKEFDAVCGPTIAWNKSKTITVPVVANGVNLLDGTHVLRVESRQWKGKHFRSMKIELPKDFKGGTFTDEGYVKSIEINLKETESK